uniref:NADH-ubiquinone oxidoreductase chain 2 n=1 Tax=Chaetocnema tibialis TaxID=1425544 RepID=A0A3G1GRU4_9CUCU|nr:NADH dehydrogenase subunit 2 [Chaetocnema tibialis]
MLFFNLMIMGTLISISAYNWFSMWMGLEINLLSIIPLFKSNKSVYPVEASLKYFITQTLASILILFSIIFLMTNNEFLNNYNYFLMMGMNSALLTKLGAAPFHSWFPEVSEGLNWINNLILLTWQKIAPSILLMYNINTTYFIMIIIFCSLIGGIYGINQISLRKILVYSSINHISWMLSSMFFFKTIWMTYFMIYSIINTNIIFIFKFLNIYYLQQLMMIFNYNKFIKLIYMMNFLSLGGLPPSLGFYPKWLVLNMLINNNFYTLSLIMVMFTLLTLFFYIRIMMFSLTLTMTENFFIFKMNFKNLFILNSFILMSLPISLNLFNLL